MATDWKWRMMLFVRAADNTPENRTAFAQLYVDGGSGETLENERKMLDNAVKFSTTGQLPAQGFGIETAVKASMRDGFKTLLEGLTNARYVVVANTTLPQYVDGEIIETTFNIPVDGSIITWQDVVAVVERDFGVIPIVEEEPV